MELTILLWYSCTLHTPTISNHSSTVTTHIPILNTDTRVTLICSTSLTHSHFYRVLSAPGVCCCWHIVKVKVQLISIRICRIARANCNVIWVRICFRTKPFRISQLRVFFVFSFILRMRYSCFINEQNNNNKVNVICMEYLIFVFIDFLRNKCFRLFCFN